MVFRKYEITKLGVRGNDTRDMKLLTQNVEFVSELNNLEKVLSLNNKQEFKGKGYTLLELGNNVIESPDIGVLNKLADLEMMQHLHIVYSGEIALYVIFKESERLVSDAQSAEDFIDEMLKRQISIVKRDGTNGWVIDVFHIDDFFYKTTSGMYYVRGPEMLRANAVPLQNESMQVYKKRYLLELDNDDGQLFDKVRKVTNNQSLV